MMKRFEQGGFHVDFQPMSPDEMQRMMQFLLNQQALFEANFAKSSERFDALIQKLSAKTDHIADGLVGLTAIVGQLAAAQLRTDEQLGRLDARVDDLGEYIKAVGSHLSVVVDMFERHLREDHGRPPS